MDFPNIPVAQEDWLPTINAYFKKISDNQPWPMSWYKGTWSSPFEAVDSTEVPSLFTYRLSDRMTLVSFSQQFRTNGTAAAYKETVVANFTQDLPTPYVGYISNAVTDIATAAPGFISVTKRQIILTTGEKALSSGHIFASAAWLSFK